MASDTVVMSDERKTARLSIPMVYESQVARLHSIMLEKDADGPLWNMSEGSFPDPIGMPGRRYCHVWRIAESPLEAFHLLAPRMLEEVAMFAFNLSIRESEFGQWIVTLEATEKTR